jgi:hypothetical protein
MTEYNIDTHKNNKSQKTKKDVLPKSSRKMASTTQSTQLNESNSTIIVSKANNQNSVLKKKQSIRIVSDDSDEGTENTKVSKVLQSATRVTNRRVLTDSEDDSLSSKLNIIPNRFGKNIDTLSIDSFKKEIKDLKQIIADRDKIIVKKDAELKNSNNELSEALRRVADSNAYLGIFDF